MRRVTFEDFVKRSNRRHGHYYSYIETSYKKLSDKTEIICPVHGSFVQNAKNHTNGDGCPKCGGVYRRTQQEFIDECNKVHENAYDYTITAFANNRTKIDIICPTHGEFSQIAGDHIIGKGCPKCAHQTIDQDEFIKQARKIHHGRYDYDKTVYTKKHDSVIITCRVHGDFTQLAHNHLAGKGCKKCRGGTRFTLDQMISAGNHIHNGKYDYSKVEYINATTPVTIMCPIHGEFIQKPVVHINHQCGCGLCGNNGPSKAEITISNLISDMGVKVVSNSRKIIPPKELDIYLPEHKLAIEYCGLYWHSELMNKGRSYHKDKYVRCRETGIRLITIFEDEWLSHPDIVMNRITHAIGNTPVSVFARKCEAREITRSEARAFLDKYHIQGYTGCRHRYGLFNNDELVSVMTFAIPSIAKGGRNDAGTFEISRFASSIGVVGGGSKLLKHFERDHEPSQIFTYADLRWGDGDGYTKMGFDFVHDSSPNYWYFKDPTTRKHRFGLRKNKDDVQTLTEWENRKLQGWNRIWDCGHRKFRKTY